MTKKWLFISLFWSISCLCFAKYKCPNPCFDIRWGGFKINSALNQATSEGSYDRHYWYAVINKSCGWLSKESIDDELFWSGLDSSYENNGTIYCIYKPHNKCTTFYAFAQNKS